MKIELTTENIKKAILEFSNNSNFTLSILPRLKVLYYIKEELDYMSEMSWYFEYNYVNINNNRIIIEHLPSANTIFNFYYEIPLTSRFELRAFLGNSSLHFIDINNYILKQNLIQENDYKMIAEYRKVPYFIVNESTNRYNNPIIRKFAVSSSLFNKTLDTNLLSEIKNGIIRFNKIFNFTLNNFNI